MKTIPVTLPFSTRISFGPQPQLIVTPSSLASLISSTEAGISGSCSKLNWNTELAAFLADTREASMATFPPPTTTTFPANGALPQFASCK